MLNEKIHYEFNFFFYQEIRLSFEQKCNRERVGKWNAEQRLICDLLDNYQVRWGRPVRNMTEDVEVRFGLQLIHISDLVSQTSEYLID